SLKDVPEENGDYMLTTKPEVRDCNWMRFKNRFDTSEPLCSIETFMASDDMDGEMEEEQLARLSEKKRKEYLQIPRKPVRKSPQNDKTPDPLERIRINSAIILAYLAKVSGESSWAEKPHTFLKPFRVLIYFHDKMQQEFESLEKEFGDNLNGKVGEPQGRSEGQDAPHEGTSVPKQQKELQDMMRSHKAYEDMKCYIEFAAARIIPRYHMFDNRDYRDPCKIRYDDIWTLFRPGQFVFDPIKRRGGDSKKKSPGDPSSTLAALKLLRVFYIETEAPSWEVDDLEPDGGVLQRDLEPESLYTYIWAYYIDYDGDAFCGVGRCFKIARFDGEKEITKLEIYPVRFDKDYEKTIEELQQTGRQVQQLLSDRHAYRSHQGWTLVEDPTGQPRGTRSGSDTPFPEFIESDVIIDFHEAYKAFPWWKPSFTKWVKRPWSPETEYDHFAIVKWSNEDRSTAVSKVYEIMISSDDVADLELAEVLKLDRFISKESLGESGHTEQELSDEDLALLPARVFAYALRERSFVNADVRSLRPIPPASNTFSNLQIGARHKEVIMSTVFEHFERKKVQREAEMQNRTVTNQDFIRGKGRGLIILLHGPPGVGKTATAEAVSDEYKKPLFLITCGDLGTVARTVESTLYAIFRLANLWDCILLLDEADIFLSQRQKTDDNIHRNALVSVFLRTLEYYSGILFLTTNRVGVMDDAITSRVHLNLCYPSLGLSETTALFQINIHRLARIEQERAMLTGKPQMGINDVEIISFATEHFGNNSPNNRWNGRQIRNAFQIASSLAHFQSHKTPDPAGQPCIGREHFEKVEELTKDYEQYREKIFSATSAELASQREERALD
ncbi:P-loop containing nucleoside triphosphate hydrolase protein, partial [Thozetella sp. PMI_491]